MQESQLQAQSQNLSQSRQGRDDRTYQQAFDTANIIKAALFDYEDIDEEEFVVVEDNSHHQNINNAYLLYSHHTLVPIGANFQVNVSSMMDITSYRAKSSQSINALKLLKIHDPEQGNSFYQQYINLIQQKFGPGRTYEDANYIRNALKRLNSSISFQEYININFKFWQNYFKSKDRTIQAKTTVKKRKKQKGSIPTSH